MSCSEKNIVTSLDPLATVHDQGIVVLVRIRPKSSEEQRQRSFLQVQGPTQVQQYLKIGKWYRRVQAVFRRACPCEYSGSFRVGICTLPPLIPAGGTTSEYRLARLYRSNALLVEIRVLRNRTSPAKTERTTSTHHPTCTSLAF